MSKHYVVVQELGDNHIVHRVTYLSGGVKNTLVRLGRPLTWSQIQEGDKVKIYDTAAEGPMVGIVVEKFNSPAPHPSSPELDYTRKIIIEFLQNGLSREQTYVSAEIGLEPLPGGNMCRDKRIFLHP